MSRFALIAAVLLAAATAAAQTPPPEPPAPPSASVLVPVVGKVFGAGSVQWRTDVDLINNLGRDVMVMLTLPTAPEEPFLLLPLPAGATQRFTDVIAAFAMDRALSPLLVKTINSRKVYITGNVMKPGTFPLTGEMTVLQLIAVAGGLQEYADSKNIVILRKS